jgi:type VI secretion system protein ImpA
MALTETLAMTPAATDGAAPAASTRAAGASQPGVVATRADAVEAMRKVRDFFRQTEPHSPLSYLVDQALRWSQMPLHMLVRELITDESALHHFQMRTGVQTNDEQAQQA